MIVFDKFFIRGYSWFIEGCGEEFFEVFNKRIIVFDKYYMLYFFCERLVL